MEKRAIIVYPLWKVIFPQDMASLHSPRASRTMPPQQPQRSAPPSLLPAFEIPSSPSLPRPSKRVALNSPGSSPVKKTKYPTPVATSSTNILSSSPSHLTYARRPTLPRTASTLSERVPLGAVPFIELDGNGEPTLMGRSSNSSHYQLSNNKLISRVHVKATYFPAEDPNPERVEIVCLGWNVMKIHCQGKVWELAHDDSFTSEAHESDIMLDVQDARVLVRWPRKKMPTPSDSDCGYDLASSPMHGSPIVSRARLQSPVSPSPAARQDLLPVLDPLDDPPESTVQIYEDNPSDEENGAEKEEGNVEPTQSTQHLTQFNDSGIGPDSEAFSSDQDEENDPVIHSFGPFGMNLLPRMQSFTAVTPEKRRTLDPLHEASLSPQRPAEQATRKRKRDELEEHEKDTTHPITHHIINQLAYSRLNSTPLSTLFSNLPISMRSELVPLGNPQTSYQQKLKDLLADVPCIGVVSRQGKDAAGQPLENEYHYLPDLDTDEQRRGAVTEELRKPGLRACRKQHKVHPSQFNSACA